MEKSFHHEKYSALARLSPPCLTPLTLGSLFEKKQRKEEETFATLPVDWNFFPRKTCGCIGRRKSGEKKWNRTFSGSRCLSLSPPPSSKTRSPYVALNAWKDFRKKNWNLKKASPQTPTRFFSFPRSSLFYTQNSHFYLRGSAGPRGIYVLSVSVTRQAVVKIHSKGIHLVRKNKSNLISWVWSQRHESRRKIVLVIFIVSRLSTHIWI